MPKIISGRDCEICASDGTIEALKCKKTQLKIPKPRNIKASLKSEAKIWCRHTDSNCGPTDYKSVALPTELCRHGGVHFTDFFWSRKPKNNRLNCFGRICLFDQMDEKFCFWLCAKKSPICADMGEGESRGFTMDMSRL